MWILFIIIHVFALSASQIAIRHSATDLKVDSLVMSVIISTATAVPAFVGILICGVDFTRYDTFTIWGLIGDITLGVLFCFTNAKALELMEAGTYTFLYNLRIGFVSALGIIFLGEDASLLRLIGGGLVFIAGFIIIRKIHSRKLGVLLGITNGISIACITMFEKWLIPTVGYTNIIFPACVIVAVILWIILLISKITFDWKLMKSPVLITLLPLRCVAMYSFTLSMALGGLLSVCTYFSSLSFITTSVAGIIFLKERDMMLSKMLAAIVAIVGVTLVFLQ